MQSVVSSKQIRGETTARPRLNILHSLDFKNLTRNIHYTAILPAESGDHRNQAIQPLVLYYKFVYK